MVRDLAAGAPPAGERADVWVIGAGAAGIVLAMELARRGKRVVVLEGGGPEVEEDSQEPYRSEIAGQHHNGVHVGRFRSAGGSTTRWGGQILELDALDFERRAWIAGSGWPVAKDELEPHYARAIELEGLGRATLEDAAVWREVGMKEPEFAGFESFFSRWCPETNFARLHGKALAEDPNISVWLHANAVGVERDEGRVAEVRCRTLGGVEAVFCADEFVWCMGGIESVRFFLQPELAAGPWHRSGLLGRFFQDHIIAAAAELELTDAARFHAEFDNIFSRGYKYQPKLRLRRELQEQHGTLNVAAMMLPRSDSDAVGAEIKGTAKKLLRGRFGDVSGAEVGRLLRDAPLFARQSWRYAVAKRAYVPAGARIELGVHCEQEPQGASVLRLSGERDRLGMLRTQIDWRVADLEVHSIRVCVEAAAEALRPVARVVADPELLDDPEAFKRKCGDGYHHMGGMRMSASPAEGVVDRDLKLHGMSNAYVCSGAVFPCSGFSNPTHTVLALAVRLAEHLAKG